MVKTQKIAQEGVFFGVCSVCWNSSKEITWPIGCPVTVSDKLVLMGKMAHKMNTSFNHVRTNSNCMLPSILNLGFAIICTLVTRQYD